MLASRLGDFEGLRVLDLFAGMGALGLEALVSRRGALHLRRDRTRPALDALKTNIAKLGLAGTEVRATSVLALGPAAQPYDLILADPPYGTGAGAVALDKLGRLGWFAPTAWISMETTFNEDFALPGFTIDTARNHGKAKITLLRPDADQV